MIVVEVSLPDLWFDPNAVGDDMVVECWISNGPRADDTSFDPAPGDWLVLDDGDEAPVRARVVARSGDRVSVRVDLAGDSSALAV
jgi:hypothetical protein